MDAEQENVPAVALLERDGEIERIRRALGDAAAGRGSLTVFEGAAGTGKSALLERAMADAEAAGARSLAARGDELETGFAFGVVIQLLARPARELAESDPRALDGAAGIALPLLERTELAQLGPAPGFALLHGLHWLVAALAERTPLLLAIDDAQWCDLQSLRFLLYLAQRLEELSVAIMLAVRTGEPVDSEAEGLLARLTTHPLAAVSAPQPLGRESVARIIGAKLGTVSEELAEACRRATGGNPFLLRELVAAAAEQGGASAEEIEQLRPESIRRSIPIRLGRFGADAAAVAAAIALLGPAASPRLVAELAGLDSDRTRAAIDSLASAQIVSPDVPLRYAHPIVRGAIYADISDQERARRHRRAAELLHEAGAAPEEVASHLLLAEPGPDAWAASVLAEAGRLALERGDPVAAQAAFRGALDESGPQQPPALLVALGRAEVAAGDPAAAGHLERAAAEASDPLERAGALGALGLARSVLGDTAGAFAPVRAALAQIPPGEGGLAEAELILHGAMSGRSVPRHVVAVRALLAEPRPGPGDRPSLAEVVRRGVAVFDWFMTGRRERALEDALWTAEQLRDPEIGEAAPPTLRSIASEGHCFLGLHDEALALAGDEIERHRRTGNLIAQAVGLEARCLLWWARGEVSSYLADAETALRLNPGGWETATVPMRSLGAEMLVEAGDREGAERLLDIGEETMRRLPDTWGWVFHPYGRARVALASREWARALEEARIAGERAAAVEGSNPEWVPWRPIAAIASAHLGETDEALALAEEERRLASGSARGTGVALACLGAIRRDDDGIEPLEAGVAELDGAGAALEATRARVALGSALRRSGRPRDARGPLREAVEASRRLGARGLSERALEELRAAGGRPRREALSGGESLTPSQRRVAEMAAEGMSNREIAESLFVTRRTVETHLTQAYAKLEISSRGELAAALREG